MGVPLNPSFMHINLLDTPLKSGTDPLPISHLFKMPVGLPRKARITELTPRSMRKSKAIDPDPSKLNQEGLLSTLLINPG